MLSAVALFCEDIREEKAGTYTIIGIFSDNISVPGLPFAFAKLGIYARLTFPVSDAPSPIALRLVEADGKEVPLTVFGEDIIETARKQSIEKGAVNGGLIATALIVGFGVRQAGRMN